MLDAYDGKELPVMYRYENARQKHIEIYGSFLHCQKTGHLCSFMENEWITGRPCSRIPCILEDPEDIALKKIQAERRMKREIEAAKKREKGEEEHAPIRRQTKSGRDMMLERIARLESESERAYRDNKPWIGEDKLCKAIALRRELKEKEEKKKR